MEKIKQFGELHGLRGCRNPIRNGALLDNPEHIGEILTAGYAGTNAGNCGAINVWKADDGTIYCERQVYMRRMDEKQFKKVGKPLKNWIAKNLKNIE